MDDHHQLINNYAVPVNLWIRICVRRALKSLRLDFGFLFPFPQMGEQYNFANVGSIGKQHG